MQVVWKMIALMGDTCRYDKLFKALKIVNMSEIISVGILVW